MGAEIELETGAPLVAVDQEVPALLAGTQGGVAGVALVPAVRVAPLAWELPVAAAVAVEVEAGGGENSMNREKRMRSKFHGATASNCLRVVYLAILCCIVDFSLYAQSATPSGKAFNTPQEAAETLVKAAETYDVAALLEIFGADGKDFISSADPIQDKNIAVNFAAKAHEKNLVTLDPNSKAQAVLSVGKDNWPFPIPIVKEKGKWYFDSKQGREEILFRRIGANELDAIQVCRGFVEAQHEYASDIHDKSGINQFAQRIISTPGKHDGLYWQNADGTSGGPISEAVARTIEEGYVPGKTSGYHGYYFKVLKGQGPAAHLGQLDYVIEGVMLGGFALVAFPAEYRITGVKTFMVSYDGLVYEKDLGPETLSLGQKMERYNPDKSWHPTGDEWPGDNAVARSTD